MILSLNSTGTTSGWPAGVDEGSNKDCIWVMITIIHVSSYPYYLLRFLRSGPVLSTLPATPFEIQSEQNHTSGSGGLRLTHGR